MPYLKIHQRADAMAAPITAGDLNFCITSLVDDFIKRKGLTYAILNEAIGALECAKLELYRRVVEPYEDTKIRANGDVYSTENLR